MALYFDSIYSYEKITNALDPSRETFPFLSYKFLDWSQKIAPNNLTLLCYHDQWQQLINGGTNYGRTSEVYLQFQLHGPGTRAGYFEANGLEPSSFGMRLFSQSDYIYNYSERNYTTTNSTHKYKNSSYQLNHGGVRIFTASQLNNPRKSWVLYSDEPGDEWFAWCVQESDADFVTHAVLHKAKNINPAIPSEEDFGWLLSTDNMVYGFSQSIHNAGASLCNSQTWQCQLRYLSKVVGDTTHAWLTDTVMGQPMISQAGYYMGHQGDRILYTTNLVQGYSYRLTDGREYLALSGDYAVRYV
jgi:hypothetical protein